MAFSDRELLARLIQCEAGGEGENGMKAVAGVVMNRVHAKGGEYARVGQGSIRNIIFQPYQFVCASETEGGAYNPQNIYNMRPEQIHYDIADWAIAGNRLPDVAESLWFYNPFGPLPVLLPVQCGILADADRRPLLLQPNRCLLQNLRGAIMMRVQNTYTPAASAQTMSGRPASQMDWSTEITPAGQRQHPAMVGTESGRNTTGMTSPAVVTPPELSDMRNDLPEEVIQAPTSVGEAYLGSWKALLSRYEGSYVVATFLVGTQNTVSWEGILFDVGNDYLTIYQEARDRYIVSDYYSLKFVEFYDIQRRQRCAELLREDGWQSNGLSDSMSGGMGSVADGMSGMGRR